MARSALTSHRLLLLTLLATLVAAFLPNRALSWTRTLSQVARLPINPLTDGMNRLRQWIRPTPSEFDHLPGESRKLVAEAIADRDSAMRLLRESELRIRDLERQLEQLQRIDTEGIEGVVRPLVIAAPVLSQHPDSAVGSMELKAGSREGITPGTIGVYNGDHLLGRVSSVTPFTCTFVPLASRDHSAIRAVVFPSIRRQDHQSPLTNTMLRPDGEGSFVGEVHHDAGVAAGDDIALDDPAWPPVAQTRRIGRIVAIEPIDDQPLKRTIVVRPYVQPQDVYEFTLLRMENDPRPERQP
jgi:cell shape-determining protein MreC